MKEALDGYLALLPEFKVIVYQEHYEILRFFPSLEA
jgi:hypothetical protein